MGNSQRTAPRVLTIAGSDSGGGAGIQADLKTLAALGVYGMSAITAVTAQSTTQVNGYVDLPPEFVGRQIDTVVQDIRPDAVKTGMLATADVARVVAAKVREHRLEKLVVDPVMVSGTGARLLADDAIEVVKRELFPLATVVTPNRLEAEALLGRPLGTWQEVREAARSLVEMGARAAVIKGGHVAGARAATDVLYDGREWQEYSGPWVDLKPHGAGCTVASAIAAGLAKGIDVREAVALAKSFVTKALQSAYAVGHGTVPLHHFYRLWQPLEAF